MYCIEKGNMNNNTLFKFLALRFSPYMYKFFFRIVFLLFPDKVNTFLHANSQDILENFPKFCRHFLWQFSRICNKKFKTNSPVLTQPLWMWHVIHPCESWELLYRGSKFSIVKQRQMCFKLCILNVYCKSWKEICIKSAFYQVTLGY